MKVGHVLFSAVQFVFAALIILLGVFCIGLEHAVHFRIALARFIAETTASFSIIGALILGCGVLLLVGFYFMHRGAYYRLKMGKREHLVDPMVIRGYVEHYWKEVFPENDYSVDVNVSGGQKLEIYVELPLLSEDRQEQVLVKTEKELTEILQKHLGYKREFGLSVLIKS